MFNNKNKNARSVLWTGAAILAIACGSTDISEKLNGEKTQANVGLRIQANSTASTAALTNTLASVAATNLTVTAGHACIEEIKIKLPDGISCAEANFVKADNIKCEVETETEGGEPVARTKVKITGPFLMNLVTGETSPSLADIAIPSGAYREIEFRFGPDCVLGGSTSIAVEGTMLDSHGDSHDFAMALENTDDLKIKSSTDVQVLEGQANGVFANLILNTWFGSVDFVDCLDHDDLTPDGGGVIQIDKDTVATGKCDKIYDDLKDGVKDCMEFEDRDVNDDGVDDHGGDSGGGHGADGLVR